MSSLSCAAQVPNGSQHLSIPRLLGYWSERTPNASAFLAPGREPLTFSRLYRHVENVVQTLQAMGLSRQDRVALVLPHGPEMSVACLAVAAGVTCAPLNPAYSASEFDLHLSTLRPKALIVQEGTDSPVRAVAQAHDIRVIELACMHEAETGLFTLAADGPLQDVDHEFASPDDVAFVLHTSGTTSRPKIVPLTHTNVCAAAHNLCTALTMVERDRGLNMMPLFHTGGIVAVVLTSVAAGASTVCLSGFDTSQFFACLEAFRPTWYLAVPAMHQAILAHVEQHREIVRRCPLRFIRSGAAALPTAARAELENVFDSRVIEVWGMTEASGPVTCNPPPLRQRKTGSVGVPIGSEVAIMDKTGNLLATGEVGEVVVRGANVMEGYDDDPEANEHAFTRGWFRSGDAGYLDTDGYLFLTGRLKDIINRGGENIAPQEVDDVLMAHPSVAQAVTFTVPHPTLGEDLAAAVVLHPNTSVTEGDIRQFSAMRLAAHKVPVQVFIVEKIPQGPMGKPLRHGLAEKLGLMAHDLVPHGASAEFAAPHTLMEETLTKIWAQVLDLDHVDLHENFAHLGGDSIHVTRLISRVREVMHVDLSFLSFFEAPTVAGMARSIEAAIQTASNLPAPPLQPVPRREMPPLSYAQQRLWFLEQLETNRDVYNLPLGWRFTGALNTHALADSLNEIVRRHEILRTTFPSVDGYPVQAIAPASALPLRVIDFQGLLTSERDTAVQCLISEEGHRPFDLAHGPLIRISLLRLTPEDHILLLVLHHVIFDGWSAEIFWHELTALYTAICTGQPASLPDLPIQYADFAVWQRQWFQGERLSEQLAYWQQQLGHHLPMLHLPTDHPRPPIQTFQGAQQTFALSIPVSTALKRLSRQAGVTLFMTLLAALKTLLSRYTGQTDLVVGTPVAGRTRVETESLLGFFVNMLVLRTHLDGDPRFRDLLQRVRKVALDAYDHQEIPFEKLVEVLQPERDLSHTPLVQAVITLQQGAQAPKELAGLSVYPVTTDCNTAKFELTLSLHDTEQGLLGTLDYASDLFEAATVARMLGHFHTLLEGIVAHPEQRLSELPLLTAAERQQLLVDWNDAPVDNVQDTCIHQLFEAQVERIPGAVAVVCEAQQLTYSVLNRRANQLAHHLRLLGVGPEVCVGLCVERSLEVIVGLLGILKAGGAYVPLDPTYPQERIAFMLADAQVAVLVTQWKLIAELPEHGAHVVCLDRDWERIARQSEENPCTGMVPANLAYVMYTSGSTGKPKGVMIEHRQIQAFLDGFEYVAPGGEPCHGTAVCPFGFDVSVWECFSMLCFGRTLHVVLPETLTDPERLVRYLVDHHITSAYVPPTLLPDVASQLELHPDQIALDRLLVGVEPIKQATLQRFRNRSTSLRIVNGYGPTETTICATLFPFHSATAPDQPTPIGTRIRGYDVYLVDTNRQPVPIGLPGELLIGGVGLSRGYLNRPELTAETFIPHPFSEKSGARLYKTGDLARYLSDGNLEFLGRLDQQVKIHGHRIELEEIEVALRQHPAVREAVVVTQEDAHDGNKRLVAYWVADQESPPSPQDLRRFLQQKLPGYMIPSAFVVLDLLPLTPHGKVDRKVLPALDMRSLPFATAYVAPRTPAESKLASIWTDVLGVEQVGVHDNFFALGGDSILSIHIVARANQIGLRLTPKQLFQHQTIGELTTVAGRVPNIQAEQGSVTGPVPLTPIQNWFFEQDFPEPHHWNQARLLQAQQALNISVLENVMQHLLAHHDMLRVRFTKGPSGWQQYIADAEQAPLCKLVDVSALSETQQDRAIEVASVELQTDLKLAEGPLVRVALFDYGSDQPARLLIVLHHLVVDSVSWHILLEDLQLAYQQLSSGRAIQLPPKTTAFKKWAEELTVYASSVALQQELSYWRAALHNPVSRLPVDNPKGANSMASTQRVSGSLGGEETQALLKDIPSAYQTQITDILLTALVRAFARWTGMPSLLIDLESHGREEDIVEGIDLSRTVGWFAARFPVLLQLKPGAPLIDTLKMVKEQLRGIPHRGIGYGLLRYLSQNSDTTELLKVLPQAEVCFNYIGHLDQVLPDSALFSLAPESSGPSRSQRGNRHYLLEINSYIAAGQLQVDWRYSELMHRRTTIEELARGFLEDLRTLRTHCQTPGLSGYTPSDFPSMRLSQQELDELLSALDEPEEGD